MLHHSEWKYIGDQRATAQREQRIAFSSALRQFWPGSMPCRSKALSFSESSAWSKKMLCGSRPVSAAIASRTFHLNIGMKC
jgi:hypothetical protein